MLFSDERRSHDVFLLALAVSLLLHMLVLAVPVQPPHAAHGPGRIRTRLAAKKLPPPPPARPPQEQEAPPPLTPSRPPRFVAAAQGRAPLPDAAAASAPQRAWSPQEKAEMDEFLESLEAQAKARPSLAQRSLAMARDMGRDMARSAQDDDGTVSVERLPDSPPVSPFSLEMYLDSLVTKLNRSASFVRRGQRRSGSRNAAVQLRLNPNGTIKTFLVLNSGDQHDEIAYIQALVERAAPYSPFPPDLTKSAKSLAITICIVPTHGGGSLGFSRNLDGHSC